MRSPLSLPKRYICAAFTNGFAGVIRRGKVSFATRTPRSFWNLFFLENQVPKPLKPFTKSHGLILAVILLLVNILPACQCSATTNTLFWLFNSLGNEPDATHNPPAVFVPPDNTYYLTNISRSGNTWVNLQNSLTNNTSLVPNWVPAASNHVICLENGNYILLAGGDMDQTVNASSNCLTTCKAHTNFVILCTAPFRGDLSLSQSNTLNLVNDFQRYHFNQLGADSLIDLNTNVLLNPYIHPENFQSDHLHWNTSGALIAAQQIAAQWPGQLVPSAPPPTVFRYRFTGVR